MDNNSVIYLNLPTRIKGFVIHNPEDGFNTIVLNPKHSYFQNLKTYAHELQHIKSDDFNSILRATQIEAIRH